MKLEDICRCVYPACPKLTSQDSFLLALFKACGGEKVSTSYAKQLFTGAKGYALKLKEPLRGKDNYDSLLNFFET